MQRRAEDVVGMLKAVGNQNRLLLLCQMLDGKRSVNDLAETLGVAQSVVSQHLSLLRREGLVQGRREGQSIYYRISDERVHALMAALHEVLCKR
ncbi:transcriptional regulator [Dyella choica]|uniref:Transcriptional regulator n=2 Tax=Dyella choica TaxID=1927959 RepID=A0A432M889_9GAMM|nr:transcriptional regulator [Dyella choica]